jgi:hypothetical protein
LYSDRRPVVSRAAAAILLAAYLQRMEIQPRDEAPSTSTGNPAAPHPTLRHSTTRHTAQSATTTTTRRHNRPSIRDLNRVAHGETLVQLVVVEDKLPALAAPVHDVEEDVDAALDALADAHGLHGDRGAAGEVDDGHAGAVVGLARVLLQPLPQQLVPAPVARGELLGGEFLHDVVGHLVEDAEEGFWKFVSLIRRHESGKVLPSLSAATRPANGGTLFTVYAPGSWKSGIVWRSWKSNVLPVELAAGKGVNVG